MAPKLALLARGNTGKEHGHYYNVGIIFGCSTYRG